MHEATEKGIETKVWLHGTTEAKIMIAANDKRDDTWLIELRRRKTI